MAIDLCAFGCVATTAEILEWEFGLEATMDIYQRSRGIIRIRNGLYACAHLDGATVAALAAGGPLDCISALERAGGIATLAQVLPTDGTVHVRYRRGDRRARDRIAASARPIAAHWHEWRVDPPTVRANRIRTRNRQSPIPRDHVPPAEALAQTLLCLAPDQSVRVVSAVIASGLLAEADVAAIVAASPRRTRAALRRAGLTLPRAAELRPSEGAELRPSGEASLRTSREAGLPTSREARPRTSEETFG